MVGWDSHFVDMVMDALIRNEIVDMGADPDFVEFVMSWHGVIGATSVDFTVEKESPAHQKKIKRWTQRDFGAQWKFYWQVILNECWRARRKMVLQRGLFRMEPHAPMLDRRRQSEAKWNAIFDLRTYFIKIDARPHMKLLATLFFPNQLEDTFAREWQGWKEWFTNEKGAERLERLERFYKHHHARILDTLRTGIPFYEKWASASPVGPSGVRNLNS